MLLKNHAKKVDLSAHLVPRPTLHAETPKTQHAIHDPFRGLPVEIREHILELLDFRDLSAVRAASCPMRSVVPSNALWRKSFSANTPWLYEIEDVLGRGNEQQSFDLCLSMEELERRSTYCDDIDGLDFILANRRRVWSVCETIAKRYARLVKETDGLVRKWTLRDDGCFEISV